MAMNPLEAGARQWLADMTDAEYAALVAEVREPADDQADGGIQSGRDRYTGDAAKGTDSGRNRYTNRS